MCLTREKPSPKNRIRFSEVAYAPGSGTLLVANMGRFAEVQASDVQDTNSMDPAIDAGNKVIIARAVPDDLRAGDMVITASPVLLHRITKVGRDGEGRYFKTRGDNNLFCDGYKWRDVHMAWVVLGVLY